MPDNYYEITTPAAEEPVTFSESSNWCRDIDSMDESLVEGLITSAIEVLQNMTNRVFISTVFNGKISGVEYSDYEQYSFVTLKKSPLISVSEIRINGDILSSTYYAVKKTKCFSRIWLIDYPDLDEDIPYPIEVDFTAGMADSAANCSNDIKIMIQQLVLFWYENRGDLSTDAKQKLPFEVQQLIKKNRIVRTF